jgi:hypothetical protein
LCWLCSVVVVSAVDSAVAGAEAGVEVEAGSGTGVEVEAGSGTGVEVEAVPCVIPEASSFTAGGGDSGQWVAKANSIRSRRSRMKSRRAIAK